jgi:hypothetical protein
MVESPEAQCIWLFLLALEFQSGQESDTSAEFHSGRKWGTNGCNSAYSVAWDMWSNTLGRFHAAPICTCLTEEKNLGHAIINFFSRRNSYLTPYKQSRSVIWCDLMWYDWHEMSWIKIVKLEEHGSIARSLSSFDVKLQHITMITMLESLPAVRIGTRSTAAEFANQCDSLSFAGSGTQMSAFLVWMVAMALGQSLRPTYPVG